MCHPKLLKRFVDFCLLSRDKYVLGGVHLTNPAFLPWAILKEITGTENGHALKNIHQDGLTLEELNRQQVTFDLRK